MQGALAPGADEGVAQVLDGRESALRFYETTNASAAVGFFSNRNHQASLQLAAMPMVTIVLMSWASRSGVRALPVIALGAGLFLLLATGTFLSESRAGVLLAPVVGVACLLLALHRTPLGLSRRTLLVSAAAAIVLTLGAGALVLRQMPDLAASVTTDIRAKVLPVIAAEAVRQMPFGSGLGTLDDIYRTQERPETLTNAFLNHAHNDYLEIWLETGLVGVALIILFLVWFGRRAIEIWSSRDPRYDVARGGTIVVGLLLVHSLVDYPLRTAAMSVVFGFACGLLFTPFGEPAGEQTASRPANDAALPRRSRQLTGRR